MPKTIKDEAYAINLDEYANASTHWIALYALNNNITYFDSFVVENIPKEVKNISIDLLLQQVFIECKHMTQ